MKKINALSSDKQSQEKIQELKRAYVLAEDDADRLATIQDWAGTDIEDWA